MCCSQSTTAGTVSTFAIAASQKPRSSQIQASTYEPSSSLASVTSISPAKFSFAASTIAPRLARNGCSWSSSTTYLLNSRVLLNVTSFCVADTMTTLNHDDNILSRRVQRDEHCKRHQTPHTGGGPARSRRA